MSRFALNYTDDEAFEGLVKRAVESETSVLCPVCRGFGHWIYYKNPRPDSHAYRDTDACIAAGGCRGNHHFMRGCFQCNSWGVVNKGSKNATCIHDFKFKENLGLCYNLYECSKCGQQKKVDSSG